MVRNQGSSAGHAVRDSSSKSFPSRNGNRKRRGPTNLDTHSKPKVKVIVKTAQADRGAEAVPVDLQQDVLDVFGSAFSDVLDDSPSDKKTKSVLQEVKGHLYNRDFAKAFGSEEYLEIYAARWSASRALGYIEVFTQTLETIKDRRRATSRGVAADLSESAVNLSLEPIRSVDTGTEIIDVLCLGGGGGAELCALAAALKLVEGEIRLHVSLVDSADWSKVLQKLEAALTGTSGVSEDATDATQETSVDALTSASNLRTTFNHFDILDPGQQHTPLNSSIENANIITLAFTLNELYTASISKTQKFLLNLTISTQRGSFLLVIDSPGSYSTVTLNGSEKQYPMQWLLEHTLLTTAPKALAPESELRNPATIDTSAGPEPKTSRPPRLWDCIDSTPSRWFRLPPGLKYPLELENMRYQMSLWRRL